MFPLPTGGWMSDLTTDDNKAKYQILFCTRGIPIHLLIKETIKTVLPGCSNGILTGPVPSIVDNTQVFVKVGTLTQMMQSTL